MKSKTSGHAVDLLSHGACVAIDVKIRSVDREMRWRWKLKVL
jgi:hypothetical protein